MRVPRPGAASPISTRAPCCTAISRTICKTIISRQQAEIDRLKAALDRLEATR